jgi:hypothetical protein
MAANPGWKWQLRRRNGYPLMAVVRRGARGKLIDAVGWQVEFNLARLLDGGRTVSRLQPQALDQVFIVIQVHEIDNPTSRRTHGLFLAFPSALPRM